MPQLWSQRLALLVTLAVSLLVGGSAHATNLLYEPFSAGTFPNGHKLSITAPNFGWNQGNSASGGNTQNSIVTNSAALSYIGLVTEAGSRGVDRIPSDGASSRNVGRFLTNSITLVGSPITNGTAYCSFLVNVQLAPTNNRTLLQLCASGGGFGGTTASPGAVPASVWVNSSGQLLVGKNTNSNPQSGTTVALPTNNTFFAVLKYTYNSADSGDDEVALFLNPVPGGSEPGSPTISTTNAPDATNIVSVGLPQGRTSDQSYHGATSGRIYMDEIRVGETWADVTPATCAPGTIYTLTGGDSLCLPHPGTSIDLSGSEVGVDYQLKRNGVDVGSPTNGTGAAIGFGLFNTAGIYTVTASNTTSGCVYLMSGFAPITTADAPAITSSPVPALGTNSVGEYILYSVGATGTALTYQWRHAGTNLINGNGYSGVTTPNLTIFPAALSHAGDYDVLVNGQCPPALTSAVANVFMKLPANLTWVGDGTANLWDITTANWTGDATIFVNGDSVTINDSGNNTLPLDLVGTMTPVAINVTNNAKNFTIGTTTTGGLGGTATLTKSGTGKLTLSTSNSFVGKATVTGGTLSIDSNDRLGAVPGAYTADQLTLDGGALEVTTSSSITANRGTTLGASGGTYDIPSGILFTNAAVVTGAGGITKISPGTLTLTIRNTFTGNMTVNDGFVVGAVSQNSGGNSVFGPITTNRTITVNNGATLALNAGNIFGGGNNTVVTPAPHIIVNQGSTLKTFINDGNNFGKITLNGGTFALGVGHGTNFGAAILTDTITVGGASASAINWDGFSLFSAANLGHNTSTNGIVFDVADATGNADADLIVNAVLRNAPNAFVLPAIYKSLIKTGPGTLRLDLVNEYRGQTIVSNGTLSGGGTILGPVIITPNGNLAPGNSIGVLTINSNLTLNGTFTAEVESPGNYDQVTGINTLTYGGTLAVVNTNGPALTVADAFPIFSAASYAGAFATITPSPGAGLTWDASTLATDGTLRIKTVATTPTNIVSSVAGSTLTLGWPASHTGWDLQTQTNALAVGLAANWVNVAGSYSTNQVSFTIDPSAPAVFYRLKSP